jgi:hypothetical protein
MSIMKKYCVLFYILLLSLNSYAQDWIRIYGQGKNAEIRYVIETYDKGYLFDALFHTGNHTYLWLFKSDINGTILWEKQIGTGSYTFYSMNAEQTEDGGYILSGSTTKYGSYDACILKLTPCAEIEWCRVLITPTNYDLGKRVKQTPEGDYLLLGGYFLTNPVSNVSLFKFNSSGDLIWQQFYPFESIYNEDQPQDLLVDNDGYLILSSRYYPDPGTTGPAIIRSYLIKTDTAGNKVWDLVYGVNDYYYSWPITVCKNNLHNYYESCSHTNYSSGDNPAIIKILHDGTSPYNHDIINTESFYLSGMNSIDILNDTNFIMVGGWVIDDIKSLVFIKTDTFGNIRTIKDLPLLSNTYVSTAKTFDNKFISVGNDATGGSWKIYAVKVNSELEYDSIYTQPFTYDSLCPHPIVSDTVNPDCENVFVGIDEPFKNPETTRLKVFPNPAKDKITVEMPKYLVVTNTGGAISSTTVYHRWKSVILEVYDLFGRKVLEKEILRSQSQAELDVSQWHGGMYVFRVVYNQQTVAGEKVIVE